MVGWAMDDYDLRAQCLSRAQGGLPDEPTGQRIFGRLREKIRIADDFDAPLPDDILDSFENGPIEPDR
jgi:hypothetical protein